MAILKPEQKSKMEKVKRMEKKKGPSISLTTQILIATVGGIIFGSIVGPWAANLKFIGDIFIRLIQMSVGNVCGSSSSRKWRQPGCWKDGIPYV